jgi:trafficking protein particle complex subunit 5
MANLQPNTPGGKESGLRLPSNGKTIYQRPLNRTKTAEISQASFAYLFGEMVTYAQRRVKGIQELEQRYVPSALLLRGDQSAVSYYAREHRH